MAALAAAWERAAASDVPMNDSDDDGARGAGEPVRCDAHLDRADWLEEPAPSRPGWLRTTCRRCGAFVGYRKENG